MEQNDILAIMRKYKLFFVSIIVLGILFNLVWEYLHIPFFQFPLFLELLNLPRLILALIATLGDTVIILLIHLFLAKIYKVKIWEIGWNFNKTLAVLLCSTISIVICEKLALSFGLWSYVDNLPVVPIIQINLSTFLQFIFIPLTTFYISSKIIYKFD